MAYRVRTVTHAAVRWYAANASVERAVRCSDSVDVFALGEAGERERANVADGAEGSHVLAQLAP
eukprot:269162-Prymnesium_polylepis.1